MAQKATAEPSLAFLMPASIAIRVNESCRSSASGTVARARFESKMCAAPQRELPDRRAPNFTKSLYSECKKRVASPQRLVSMLETSFS